jgi:hypothetical protein
MGPEKVAYLLSNKQEEEPAALFPSRKVFPIVKQLRDEVVQLGSTGIVVVTDGTKLCCNRCTEPAADWIK